MENANLSGYSVNNFLRRVDLPVPEGPEREREREWGDVSWWRGIGRGRRDEPQMTIGLMADATAAAALIIELYTKRVGWGGERERGGSTKGSFSLNFWTTRFRNLELALFASNEHMGDEIKRRGHCEAVRCEKVKSRSIFSFTERKDYARRSSLDHDDTDL